MKFDISTIPAEAEIKKAELSIYKVGVGTEWIYDKNGTFYVHNLDAEWNLAGMNTLTAVKDWSAIPFESSIVDEVVYTQGTDPMQTWYDFDVSSSVESIVSENKSTIAFFLTSVHECPYHGSGGRIYFSASEYATQKYRPKLTVTYENGVTHVIEKKSSVQNDGAMYINGKLLLNAPNESIRVDIYSVKGNILCSIENVKAKNNSIPIDLSNRLRCGEYILLVRGKTFSKKFKLLVVE